MDGRQLKIHLSDEMKGRLVAFGLLVIINAIVADQSHDHHTVPHYHFSYGVHDPHTHDHKSHEEYRDHDQVKGSYTIHDPDGTVRIVEYTAGKHTGFQAVVKRIGHAHHPDHHHDNSENGGESFVDVTHWGYGSG